MLHGGIQIIIIIAIGASIKTPGITDIGTPHVPFELCQEGVFVLAFLKNFLKIKQIYSYLFFLLSFDFCLCQRHFNYYQALLANVALIIDSIYENFKQKIHTTKFRC
jgi:hypothetical protein